MRNTTIVLLLSSLLLSPSLALGGAFEEKTSWQKEPLLETEKGVSLGRSVLEMYTGLRYLNSESFFNSAGKLQESPAKYEVFTWDLGWKFGFTDNWTFWANLPFLWSDQTNSTREGGRASDGKLGDAETGVLYQFYRGEDPMVSLGIAMRWKLPTGSEAPGAGDVNITGTGTTDVELSLIGRVQLIRNLSVGFGAGYNIRFPGAVQYLSDQNSAFTNGLLDLGDEIFAQADVTGGLEWISLQLLLQFRYRLATQVAIPEFSKQGVQYTLPDGTEVEDIWVVYAGATYQDWDVHKRLDVGQELVSSAGYTLALTPKLIFRPFYDLDITLFARFYPMAKNTIFLTDKDQANRSIENFMPMQVLGKDLGGLVIGEIGGYATYRW